jgi:hypothetical protein
LACDGTVVGIVESRDGQPLDIGPKTRIIPAAIGRALRAPDGGCRFPGCDRMRFCHGHHVKHWADGGDTRVGNLVTLCSFHHTLVHEGGFDVRVTDDGVFVFLRPDGSRIPECGPPPKIEPKRFRGIVVADPPPMGDASLERFEAALRFHCERLNPGGELNIDAKTSRCKWLGESMDYNTAIEGMQYREAVAARAIAT